MGELAGQPLIIERNLFKDCLDIYPEHSGRRGWQLLKVRWTRLMKKMMHFLQFFYENFSKVSMAPNGRINIPSDYMAYGKIKKNARMIGMGNSIRMWDADVYESQRMDKSFLRRDLRKKEKTKPLNHE
jgi:MraZ protein